MHILCDFDISGYFPEYLGIYIFLPLSTRRDPLPPRVNDIYMLS